MLFDASVHLIVVGLSAAALWWGAEHLVEGASRLARRLGVSELVVGLTVVALGTSAPEFAVTVKAHLDGRSALALGNIVGSNVFNLGLILGGVALMRPLTAPPGLVRRDGALLLGAVLLTLFFLRDRALDPVEGAAMVALLVAYTALLVLGKKDGDGDGDPAPAAFGLRDGVFLGGGLVAVLAGAHFMVESASALARMAGASEWLIGLTVVAVGTSTPELATSLTAAARGRHGLSAGNLIGSDLFNLLGVLGIAAALRPLEIDAGAYPALALMGAQVILVLALLYGGRPLGRAGGLALVAVALGRWTLDLR